ALGDPAHVAALQAGVIGNAHTGQHGGILAAEPGHAARAVGAQPRLLGRDPGTARREEVADHLLRVHEISVDLAARLWETVPVALPTGTLTASELLLSWTQHEAATTPPRPSDRKVVMKHISLGGLDVSRIGLGTMAMSGYYLDPTSSDAESIRTIQRAVELGVTLFDTAEVYGPYANEELVGRALKGRRDSVVVATKFGSVSHAGGGPGVLDSSPANIRTAVEGSLKRLGTDRVDLYYQHRVDPNTPIEDTVGALAELVAGGKVLHL